MDIIAALFALFKDTTIGRIVVFLLSMFFMYCLFVAMFDEAGKYVFLGFVLLLVGILVYAWRDMFFPSKEQRMRQKRCKQNKKILRYNPDAIQIDRENLMELPCVFQVVCLDSPHKDYYQGELFTVHFKMTETGMCVSVINTCADTVTVYWRSATINGEELHWGGADQRVPASIVEPGQTRTRDLYMLNTVFRHTLLTRQKREEEKWKDVKPPTRLLFKIRIGIAKKKAEWHEYPLQVQNLNEAE